MMARTYEVYLRVEKNFTNERSKRVKSFFHEKINFICLNQRIIFFILHRYESFKNKNKKKLDEKQRNDVNDIFTCEDMENISLVSQM